MTCDCGRPFSTVAAAILAGWHIEWAQGEIHVWCPLCMAQSDWGSYTDWASCDYYRGIGTCSFGCWQGGGSGDFAPEPVCQTNEPAGGWPTPLPWPDMEPYEPPPDPTKKLTAPPRLWV